MPNKRHLPNLAPWDMSYAPGRHVSHRGCGGKIKSNSSLTLLTCLKCHRKVGRKATERILRKAYLEVTALLGEGICRVFRCEALTYRKAAQAGANAETPDPPAGIEVPVPGRFTVAARMAAQASSKAAAAQASSKADQDFLEALESIKKDFNVSDKQIINEIDRIEKDMFPEEDEEPF